MQYILKTILTLMLLSSLAYAQEDGGGSFGGGDSGSSYDSGPSYSPDPTPTHDAAPENHTYNNDRSETVFSQGGSDSDSHRSNLGGDDQRFNYGFETESRTESRPHEAEVEARRMFREMPAAVDLTPQSHMLYWFGRGQYWLGNPYHLDYGMYYWLTDVEERTRDSRPPRMNGRGAEQAADVTKQQFIAQYLEAIFTGTSLVEDVQKKLEAQKIASFLDKMINSGYFFIEKADSVSYKELGAKVDQLLKTDEMLKTLEERAKIEGYELSHDIKRASTGILRSLGLLARLKASPFANDLQPTIKKLAQGIALKLHLTTVQIGGNKMHALGSQITGSKFALSFAEAVIGAHKEAGNEALKVASEFLADPKTAEVAVRAGAKADFAEQRRASRSWLRSPGAVFFGGMGTFTMSFVMPYTFFGSEIWAFFGRASTFEVFATLLGSSVLAPILGYIGWNRTEAAILTRRVDRATEQEAQERIRRLTDMPVWKEFYGSFADKCELYLTAPENIFQTRRYFRSYASRTERLLGLDIR